MRVKKMMQVLERYFLKKLALVNGDMYKKLYPKYLRKIGINIPEDYYRGGMVLLILPHILTGIIIV